jgi:uncharacterized membrane protein YccC
VIIIDFTIIVGVIRSPVVIRFIFVVIVFRSLLCFIATFNEFMQWFSGASPIYALLVSSSIVKFIKCIAVGEEMVRHCSETFNVLVVRECFDFLLV